jgi:polysaccharide biosynthesis PFTS motif protein
MSSRRPIWTYKSEFFECNVTYIEFSHVIEPNISNADEVISDRFNLFTYDEVIIASKFVEYKIQKNEFKFVKRINTNVLGVPWFSDCLVHKPNFVSRSIAVFDFEPKVFFGLSRLTELSLFSRNSMNEFLSPILKECQNLGITVYRKPKRFLDTKELYPESLDFLEDISKQPNYIEICSKVAPTSVMKEVMGVISMPPTSTALIAREKGVPSIYFDPFKKIMKNDVNLEGIEIMSTHVELRKWLHEVLESL